MDEGKDIDKCVCWSGLVCEKKIWDEQKIVDGSRGLSGRL